MHNIRTLVRGVQYAYYELVESIMHNKYELEYSCMYEKYNILCIARSMHSMHIPPYISYTLANRTLVLASSYSRIGRCISGSLRLLLFPPSLLVDPRSRRLDHPTNTSHDHTTTLI